MKSEEVSAGNALLVFMSYLSVRRMHSERDTAALQVPGSLIAVDDF
ncbi:hypothetical protein [Stenotrophomonas sp. SY1]|nr:hypothetical protein [Stenotrophomonas sp. SY1]MCD9085693.1 hypothetical protein [Stenotrophomonas sp. SY1]